MTEPCDLAVIGAGAAGLAAAIFARRRTPTARVWALDGAKKLGAKILVSGGGRCNVTNAEVDEGDFSGGPARCIRGVLRAFPAHRTRAFFEEIGVPLTEEAGGKLFPTTNRARDVLQALLAETEARGVRIRMGARVQSIRRIENGFEITTNVDKFAAARVVLATGGMALPRSGSDGAGYGIARELGHSLIPPTPALVPLVLSGSFHKDLAGVSHAVDIEVRVGGRRHAVTHGSMLWTHFGVSGPAVLDASRSWHRAKLASQEVSVFANLIPGSDFVGADARLTEVIARGGTRAVRSIVADLVPARLADAILARLRINPITRAAHLPRDHRRRLLAALLEWPLPVVSSRGYEDAEATAGGVPLEEVDSATMESRVVPGLHFAGEILDVDGRLGGFNFQWAWSSGFVAGCAAAMP